MRVAFLTQDLRLSGGVGVIVSHAAGLAADHGFDVTLVHTGERDTREWEFRGLSRLHVLPLAEAATGPAFDVAIATWWETASALFELEAERYAMFVQSLEDRFYASWEPQRIAASMVADLPIRFVTEARWIADALDALRPGERTLYVRNGVDKRAFGPAESVAPAIDGPLRVLVEGSAEIEFKGVGDALAAVGAMREPRHLTLVTPDGTTPEGERPDRVEGPVSHARMAELYGESHVVLKLSRVEGMSGPPLEGFHRGATCVTTPVTGHEEYVVHGHNALVVDWDDVRGTARALDLLARDRARLHMLRCNALQTARAWPSWDQQTAVMALALKAIRREPAPSARALGRRLTRDLDLILAGSQRQLLNYNQALVQLEEIKELRAYRWGVGVRDGVLKVAGKPRAVARRIRGD